uniref:NADH-ubiquinone oxidoreductase chain 2 n=1 Tax=Pristaulacus compressus TaxID=1414807 RepID=U5TTZ0_9HYME|nr:NADH dehydrogenase subunit 2 [Pristaulacus compressus]AGZ13111.1 NADH dehydrogenase subunit 2 [Pristaulacus compressus]
MFFSMYMNLIFIPILILSPILCISSNNWLSMWISLELNMLSFIPLLIFNKKFSNDSLILCFLIQSLSSSIFLLSLLYFFFQFNYLEKFLFLIFNKLILLSLFLKLGIFPFHFWFIKLIKSSSWMNCFIITSFQKIIPMIILFNIFIHYIMFFPLIIFSSFMSMFLSFNMMNLRSILGYSSINHTSWMLTSIPFNKLFWMFYLIFYSIILFSLINLFNMFNLNYINQMNLIFKLNKNLMKIIIFFNLISLGGMPPFLGFLSKWLIINLSLNFNLHSQIFLLILCSLSFLYIYISIFINMMMMNFSINFSISMNFFLKMNYINLNLTKFVFMFLSMYIFLFFLFLF